MIESRLVHAKAAKIVEMSVFLLGEETRTMIAKSSGSVSLWVV